MDTFVALMVTFWVLCVVCVAFVIAEDIRTSRELRCAVQARAVQPRAGDQSGLS